MAQLEVISQDRSSEEGLLSEFRQMHWYGVYTRARHEKTVAEQLVARGVEHFLPLYSSIRKWKDRRVTLQMPLFPGYIFVRLALRDRMTVQQVPGVARLVGFNGWPTPLSDDDVGRLWTGLAEGANARPHPYLTVGRRVRLKSGPLAGMQGILLRRKGHFRLVISIELIQRSVAVDADESDVEPSAPASQRYGRSADQRNA